jgi:hypothetical protein
MMSGVMAANLIAKIIAGSIAEDDGLRQYRVWLGTWFEHDVQRLRELYRELDPAPAWAIKAAAGDGAAGYGRMQQAARLG